MIKMWPYLFAAPWFFRLNSLLFEISLRGLGILNYKTRYLSGEIEWLHKRWSASQPYVVFDVGANVGEYSSDILQCFPRAEIYAFEPHPQNFARLQDANNVHSFPCAVGELRDRIQLFDYADGEGSEHASVYQDVIEDLHRGESVSYAVDMVTLDDFCEDHSIDHIDLLKLDTEGHEFKCLIGAQRLLQQGQIDAIQFEFNEMNIVSRCTFKDFWDLLSGFEFYRILPGGRLLRIVRYSPVYCEIFAYQNIVALRRPDVT